MEPVIWARDLAQRLLAAPLPRRWAHTQGVGHKAESIAYLLGDDGELLVCAAWLHDIGYAPELVRTELHPLDGARYLRDIERADERLCRLVAHHSGALNEARHRGLAEQLAAEFPVVGGLVAEALTYCDMTTSPQGQPVDVQERLSEILARYGDGSLVSESIAQARPEILASVHATEALISASGTGAEKR